MSKFHIGDRVQHYLAAQAGTTGLGTVTGINLGQTPQTYWILFDDQPSFVKGANVPVIAIEMFMEPAPRPIFDEESVFEPFKLTDDPKWETSYTKRVCDAVEQAWGPDIDSPEKDAVELLKQYHRDLAVPYTQRDEARTQLANEEAVSAFRLALLDEARETIKRVRQEADTNAESRNAWRKLAKDATDRLSEIRQVLNKDGVKS